MGKSLPLAAPDKLLKRRGCPQISQITQIKEDRGDDPRSFAIIGAAMEVHRVLGAGFLESVYHHALAIEFGFRDIPFEGEFALPIAYNGQRIGLFRADFLCFSTHIVELKALARMTETEDAQLINYLKAADCEIGLLINFGATSLQYRRRIRSKPPPDQPHLP